MTLSFDGNATTVRPRPGGARLQKPVAAARAPAAEEAPPVLDTRQAPVPQVHASDVSSGLPVTSSLNPLLHAAANLLSFTQLLRQKTEYADSEHLFQQVLQEMQQFHKKALQQHYDSSDVTLASQLLCCFIDEVVRSMPWGPQTDWAGHSLLNRLHHGGKGGEYFFTVVQRLLEYRQQKESLLEFAYVLLSLGFRGRYSQDATGSRSLEAIRGQLYDHISRYRTTVEPALSVNWQGISQPQKRLERVFPVWIVITGLACALLLLYTYFLFGLNRHSDPLAIQLASLKSQIPVLESKPPQWQRHTPRLAELLSPYIQQQQLSVEEKPEGENVILHGDYFFSSGSGEVKRGTRGVLAEIGRVLAPLPGHLIISGHTDDIPMRSLRFPSNTDLSAARAQSVAQALGSLSASVTIKAQGETQPRYPNNNAANRASNRRVEILWTRVGQP